MQLAQVDILLDAFFCFLLACAVNLILYSILLYAIYKTVTSMDDDKENQKWLKYWIFYGLTSSICSFLEHGTLIKTIICGLLLLKFNNNIVLSFSYDVVLENLMKYSFGYLEVLFNEFMYFLFSIIKYIHWSIISTFNMTDDVATSSLESYALSRSIVMKREKEIWKNEGDNITNRMSYRNGSINGGPSFSTDCDESRLKECTMQRLSKTVIISPLSGSNSNSHSMDECDNMSDLYPGLRQRR